MKYLSIASIAKNEQPYLQEWVASNLVVGVEHFFIYDNGSDVANTLFKYKDIITVINFPGQSMQMPAYSHCIQNFGNQSKWIAMIDCDEILIPQEKNDVKEVLQDYEQFVGGLGVSWRIFGSSGHKTKPNGIMMENYTMAMSKEHYENTHIKSIIQPEKTLCAGSNPHTFRYKKGYYCVSEDYKVIPGAWTPHCSEKLQLSHYFTKSQEEFMEKIKRGRADAAHLQGRVPEDFQKFDNLCIEKDESALRFVEKTKQLL